MCRGELSAVIALLMSNCEAGEGGSEELKVTLATKLFFAIK